MCVTGYLDFFPRSHTGIASGTDEDDALACQQRGGARDEGRLPVEVALAVVVVGAVVVAVAETAADDIHACRVGVFRRHRPVVFFHGLFRLLIFAAQQPVTRLRGGAYQYLWFVGGHRREHFRAVVGLAEENHGDWLF